MCWRSKCLSDDDGEAGCSGLVLLHRYLVVRLVEHQSINQPSIITTASLCIYQATVDTLGLLYCI